MNIYQCPICKQYVPDNWANTTTMVIKNQFGVNMMFVFHTECLPDAMKEVIREHSPVFEVEKA